VGLSGIVRVIGRLPREFAVDLWRRGDRQAVPRDPDLSQESRRVQSHSVLVLCWKV